MAIALEYRRGRGARRSRHAGSLPLTLRGLSGRIASAWRNYRAERELENLPLDLRKDIGYRSADTNRR